MRMVIMVPIVVVIALVGWGSYRIGQTAPLPPTPHVMIRLWAEDPSGLDTQIDLDWTAKGLRQVISFRGYVNEDTQYLDSRGVMRIEGRQITGRE
jgi:hypothetical protein